MNFLRSMKLSYRLSVLIGIFAFGFVAYGLWSFKTLEQLKVNGPLYREIVAAKDIISDTLPPPLYIIESYLVSMQMAAALGKPLELGVLEARLRRLRAEQTSRNTYWRTQTLESELASQLQGAVNAPAEAFYAEAFSELVPALQRGDRLAVDTAMAAMARSYEQHRVAVDALVSRAAANARLAEDQAVEQIRSDTERQIMMLVAALGLAIAAAVLIKRSITSPLDDALQMAQRVAAGDMRPHSHARYGDEPGLLLDALNEMGASLAAMLAERNASALSSRQARDLTERLIDTANVMVVGIGRQGEVVIFNATASKLTGYARDEVIGRRWRELPLIDPEHASRWPGGAAPQDIPLLHEHPITTRSDGQRCIAWQNTVLGEEGGEVALMAFGIDVTEQRAATEATLQAREMAEAATRSKSEFLANMSHEIRTPMNAVIGMTRLALKTDLDARQRNYLEKADRAAQGLLGVINDILDFSKMEAGKLRFEQRPMLLRSALDHLAALTVMPAQEKGLELLFDIAPEVPSELVGDPLRLGQVLLNLVNNAIKFTDTGEVIVAVRLVEQGEHDMALRFEVSDTGIGIRPEQAELLFNSFEQADTSTTRTHGGSGLGLAISRKLVEMMNGKLWLESEYGHGSRFIFTARFGKQDSSMPVRPAGRSLSISPQRVLVVDDNSAAREIMQGILESMQMRVTTSAAAQTAIDALEEAERSGDPYHLVMMDWVMPSMNGLEAIRKIRANPAISETLSIIMVTAYSRDELLMQAEDVPHLGVLDKPVTPSSVLDAIVSGYTGGVPLPGREVNQRAVVAALHKLAGASVLLVEDNEVNQQLAVEILEGFGLAVSVANNGRVALDMVQQQDFDAVLMDCQMPVMDGYEATRLIRAQARFAELPILAMTANAMSGDREKCLEAGMNEHIFKPIDADLLALLLAQWIKPADAAQAADTEARLAQRGLALCAAGIDFDGAVARLLGNEAMYGKHARDFSATQGDVVERVRAAMAKGETQLARRMVHNLKGLCGAIGATALAPLAIALEQAIIDGRDVEAPLAQLAQELPLAIAAMQEYVRAS